ncbi:MAG: nucleotidyl transferase AbiEii/AbiGii toxin family protein [Lentisphaerae bacterium]|nr:nucleotidyl transferase AbiEii/AbiGii toxin family protein [Lentisphaerota bacterium]
MHEKVLPGNSKALLAEIDSSGSDAVRGWVLAGGTGLALRCGHRISVDFDFFRTVGMDQPALRDALGSIDTYETLQDSERTLTVLIKGVKLSFFQVRDPFLYDRDPYSFFELADIREIALMKLVAIANRGSRKDFVDLYTILRDGPILQDYFRVLPEKYGQERINAYHILKSLTYFDDAEGEPMPHMLEPFNWEECKAFFVREAHAIILG